LKRVVIVVVALLALGVVYAFCIPCQFFGWMPMPSVGEVLTNPNQKPIHLVEISTENISIEKLLCVHISKVAFVKGTDNPSGILFDFPNQIVAISDNFEKSFKFFVDGWQKPIGSIEWSDVGPFIKCVDTSDVKQDKHIAHVQYNDLDSVTYSYTWVFEVKVDGIVPEVTATP
jgi:hypothetical protein